MLTELRGRIGGCGAKSPVSGHGVGMDIRSGGDAAVTLGSLSRQVSKLADILRHRWNGNARALRLLTRRLNLKKRSTGDH